MQIINSDIFSKILMIIKQNYSKDNQYSQLMPILLHSNYYTA